MASYYLSSLASEDIHEIWMHLAIQSLDAADRLVDRFTEVFELISKNPHLGEPQDNLRPGLRRVVVLNYLVFHLCQGDDITIVRVLHGARNIGADFF